MQAKRGCARRAACFLSAAAKKQPVLTSSQQRWTEDPGNAGEKAKAARKIAIAPLQLPSQQWSRESEQWSSQRELFVLVSTVKSSEQQWSRESTSLVVTASREIVTVNAFVRSQS